MSVARMFRRPKTEFSILKSVFTVSFEMTEREVYGKIAQFTHLEGNKYNVSQLMMMMMW